MEFGETTQRADLSKWWIALVLFLFAIASFISNCLFPIFEGPDEDSHYQYARLLAQGKGLPVQTEKDFSADAEGFNPPLYYLIPAVILKTFDPHVGTLVAHIGIVTKEDLRLLASEELTLPTLNPDLDMPGDPRTFVHPRAGIFSARMLNAIHWMRLFSTACGLATLIGVALIARQVFPTRADLQLLALCLVAFQPQFVFLSGVLNSDNLVTVFATFVIWRLTVLLSQESATTWDSVILGVLMGLGVLSKPNMLFLFAPITVVLYLRTSTIPRFLRLWGFTYFCAVDIAGWFFLRNVLLYGHFDVFGWTKRAQIHPIFVLPPEHRWEFLTQKFLGNLFTSFWGRFGWLTISLPIWMYIVYGLLSMAGIFAAVDVIQKKSLSAAAQKILLLCLCVVGLNVLSLICFNFRFAAYQGRLIFPSLAPIAMLIVQGWQRIILAWRPEKLRKYSWLLCLALGIMLVIVQQFVLFPIYIR